LPQLPEPPEGEELIVALNVNNGNKELNNNDTIHLNVLKRQFNYHYILLPVIFYEINSGNMLMPPDNKLKSEEKLHKKVYTSVLDYLKQNPDVKVNIFSSALNIEDADTVNKRVRNIETYLLNNGISDERITTEKIIVDASKMNRKELLEDNCFIRFDFSDGRKILKFTANTKYTQMTKPEQLFITPVINSHFKIEEFLGAEKAAIALAIIKIHLLNLLYCLKK